MKKYNLSNIMKRAWELVKKFGFVISEALKKAWREAKEMNLLETLKSNLEEMAYGSIYINAGIDRIVSAKLQEGEGSKRTYLAINCYTGNGRFKRSYKCGYVDMTTNEYFCSKYDDVNALLKEYVGK